MRDEIATQLTNAATRMTKKGLLCETGDRLSMRIPGTDEFLWVEAEDIAAVQATTLSDDADSVVLHSLVYRHRPDVGAVLVGANQWSRCLATIGQTPPVLYDEQARHLGAVPPPLPANQTSRFIDALASGGNVLLVGDQLVRVGMTRDRVVFNAELFEKVAMAFVIASSSDQRIRTIPWWVRRIAGGRLKKDQIRAAESYAIGKIPAGTSAY